MANTVVDIKRQNKTFSDGEFTYTWEDVNTDCPAFITPTGGGQAGTILGRFPEATHTVLMEIDSPVTNNDRLYRTIDGLVYHYEVLHSERPSIGIGEHHKTLYVKEIPQDDVPIRG